MTLNLESIKARDRRKVRDRDNQLHRALAGVALMIDALSPKDRLLVLNEAIRQVTEETGMPNTII